MRNAPDTEFKVHSLLLLFSRAFFVYPLLFCSLQYIYESLYHSYSSVCLCHLQRQLEYYSLFSSRSRRQFTLTDSISTMVLLVILARWSCVTLYKTANIKSGGSLGRTKPWSLRWRLGQSAEGRMYRRCCRSASWQSLCSLHGRQRERGEGRPDGGRKRIRRRETGMGRSQGQREQVPSKVPKKV